MNLKSRLTKLEKPIMPIMPINLIVDVHKLTDDELINHKKQIEQYLDQCGSYDRNQFKHLTDDELQQLKNNLLAQFKQEYPYIFKVMTQ